ncbi:SH3 domain-containing protein [Clostridium thermobutyricum]|uniref:Beta-N-acetylglucosaminidase n=1 Tax=Clostridium thermobutyricum DSM 4928 TaxID=1121339 RepID=A0A1V4SU15_9CLOT|nr:SH3 domain-containing protein [Clostridium thermobutyricum]OPX47351.1 beta-N-acetylglucosaminidase precursor [Clostridium thermobutyricum DSM 4928]
MNKRKITKLIFLAGVAVSTISAAPTIISHANTLNNINIYNQEQSNVHLQKAVITRRVAIMNNGKIVGYANAYDMAVIQSHNGNTYNVVTEFGLIGTVNKNDLLIVQNDEQDKLITLNEQEHVIHVTTDLHLRSEASANSSIITNLKEGTNLNVIGRQGQWLKVSVNGYTGFVFGDFVQNGFVNTSTQNFQQSNQKIDSTINSSKGQIVNPEVKITPSYNSNQSQPGVIQQSPNVKTEINSNTNNPTPIIKPEVKPESHKTSPEVKPEVKPDTHKTSPEVKPEVKPDTHKSTPEVKPEVKPESHKTSPEVKPEVKPDTHKTSPEVKPEVKPDTHKTSPEVKPEVKPDTHKTSPEVKPEVKPDTHKSTPEVKPEVKPDTHKTSPEVKPESHKTSPEVKPEVKPDTHKTSPEVKPEVKPESHKTSPEVKPEVKPDTHKSTPEVKPEVKPESHKTSPEVKPEVKPDTHKTSPEVKPEVKPDTHKTSPEVKPEVKPDTHKTSPVVKPVNNTPKIMPGQIIPTYSAVVIPNTATVRSAPSTNPSYESILGLVKKGNIVQVISRINGWYEIEFGGSVGYIRPDFVNTNGANIPTAKSVANKANTITVNANYPNTMKKYVAGELKEFDAIHGNKLTKSQLESYSKQLSTAINPKAADTMFEFLEINKFRNVNVDELNAALENMGVFKGQGQAFVNAAKKYGMDPIYLLSQSILETNHGHSNFANGITIDSIQHITKNKEGKIIKITNEKLSKPVTVYNFFGIGAYNSDPNYALTYAYNHGWFTPADAIEGGAKMLHDDYLYNEVKQVTPYEIRYINGTNDQMWHQYSSDIQYAQTLGELIKQYSYLYNSNDTFTFGIPKFQES